MISARADSWRWMLEKCQKPLAGSIKWLFQQQRPGWGFSPYPFTIEPSGTLGTADVISALTLATNGKYLPEYVAFLDETCVVDQQGRNETLLMRLTRAIAFLVEVQHDAVQDGGFPPLGDVFWIRRACFTDATADSALALLSARRFLQTLITETGSKGGTAVSETVDLESLIEQVEKRVCTAIQWLWKCRFTTEEDTSYWTTSEYHDAKVGRVFPTWMACMAFHIYARELKQDFRPAEDVSYEQAIGIRNAALRWLLSMYERNDFLPFNTEDQRNMSFNNTASFLSLVQSILAGGQLDTVTECYLQAVREKGALWLEAHIEKAQGTENDDLDLTPIKQHEPYIPATYQATYARLQSALWAYLDLHQKAVKDSRVFNEGLRRLVAEIDNNSYYCLEERAQLEPATSATALAIMLLMRLFHIFGQGPF